MIKQSDYALIILVVSISLVASYFIGNSVINTNVNRSEQVEVVYPINAEFSQPDPAVFNDDAINPTELINISNNKTPKPFDESNN